MTGINSSLTTFEQPCVSVPPRSLDWKVPPRTDNVKTRVGGIRTWVFTLTRECVLLACFRTDSVERAVVFLCPALDDTHDVLHLLQPRVKKNERNQRSSSSSFSLKAVVLNTSTSEEKEGFCSAHAATLTCRTHSSTSASKNTRGRGKMIAQPADWTCCGAC